MHPLSVKPNVADSLALVVETVGGLGVGQADRTVGAAASSSPSATSCARRHIGIVERRATRSVSPAGGHAHPARLAARFPVWTAAPSEHGATRGARPQRRPLAGPHSACMPPGSAPSGAPPVPAPLPGKRVGVRRRDLNNSSQHMYSGKTLSGELFLHFAEKSQKNNPGI